VRRLADENALVRPEWADGGDSPVPLEDRGQALASPEDVAAFQDRLLRLLERRTALYTMGDSSSVPRHTAGEVLRSVCFVLGIDPEQPDVPERLLSVDL
jgi:hypothetical protein